MSKEFAIYTSAKNTPKKANPGKPGDAKPKGLRSDGKPDYGSLAAERYKAVKSKKTFIITLILTFTGLLISARTAEASPVSFFEEAAVAPIYAASSFVSSELDDLDARDALNRPIKDARSLWTLREIFVASLYQLLLTRDTLSDGIVKKSVGTPFAGFSSFGKRFPYGSKDVSPFPVAVIISQVFERLKKYLYSFVGVLVAALFVRVILGSALISGFLIFEIITRQPPVLKPIFTVLRC